MRAPLWDLRALLEARGLEIRHRIRGLGGRATLKAWVVGGFTVALTAGLFSLFNEGFRFLGQYPDLKARVLGIGFSLFYFSLGMMLTLSNAVIAYGVFFRSREARFLLTTPARAENIFTYQYAEVLVYSSWAFLFLAVPLLAAYAWREGLGLGFLLGMAGLLGCFALIPAGLGTLLAMGVALLGPRRVSLRFVLILAACATAIALGFGRAAMFWKRTHGELDAVWLYSLLEKLTFADHPLLPSQWLTAAMAALVSGRWGDLAYQAYSLVSTAALLFSGAYALAWAQHRRAASRVLGGVGGARPVAGRHLDRILEPPLALFFNRPSRLLLLKDLKTFLRDAGQWSQVLVFFGLLGIYFLNLNELAYPIENYYWKNLIAFLNLSATCLTLATFTSRFVYPLVSLEGRRFWILGLLPMPRGTLLWGKFWFSFLGGLLVSGTLIAVSDSKLEVPRGMALIHVYSLVVICAGLSGLAVGIGAAFPDLREDSPAKIVSGFGGTLNLVLSLGFMLGVILLEAIPCHLHYARELLGRADFGRVIGWCSLAVLLLGAAATLIPLKLGNRAFRRMDF